MPTAYPCCLPSLRQIDEHTYPGSPAATSTETACTRMGGSLPAAPHAARVGAGGPQLAQNPTDHSLQALAAAANQAAKTEKTERPRLETLLAGRSTLSDAIILYAYEGADVQALFAKGTVPSAHVRVIELGSKQAANTLHRQRE